MAFSWIPSGASADFFHFNIWTKALPKHQQFQYLDFKVSYQEDENPKGADKKPIQTAVMHAPHADIIFDNGWNKCRIDRTAQGYELHRVGFFHHPDTVLGGIFDWVMASAHYIKPHEGNFAEKVGLKMIADSGGAQLKFRTANYVDPNHVIEAYNAGAHFGMALDLPPKPNVDGQNTKALAILARIQKKNNELFKAKRRPDLGLLNVAHGIRPDDYRLWIDTVNDPEHFQGWAIGLDDIQADYCIFRGVAILYREYGLKEDPSKWLHLFGVSGPKKIPVMAWLGRYFPVLTSDSSSYLEACRRRSYFVNHGGDIQIIGLGTGKHTNFDFASYSNSSMLPCCCKFCNTMRYFGVHTHPEFQGSFPAIMGHNAIVIKQVANQWNTLAAQMELKDYVKLVKERVGAKTAMLVQYADACMQHGPEYADKHFNNFLNGRGGLHQAAVEERVKQQSTRIPVFSVGRNKPDEIQGLGVNGSNLEIIGNYLTDAELAAVYTEFGFDQALKQLIDKNKTEKVELTAVEDEIPVSEPLELEEAASVPA